jgi:septal ring factor EnvC (AmiA/AmiB activator)
MSTDLTAANEDFSLAMNAIEATEADETHIIVADESTKQTATYMFDDVPKTSNMIVTAQRHDILGTIDLNKLMFQLKLCPDLYHVAYCATYGVTGSGLGAKVKQLNNEFYNQIIKSISLVDKFQKQADAVPMELLDAYYMLLETEPASRQNAIDMIAGIGERAAMMATESEKIAAAFETLKDGTSDCLVKVTSSNETLRQKYLAFQEEERKMNASLAAYKELVSNYDKQVKNLQDEIDETKADIKKEEDRAYNLAFAGMITGAVTGFVGAVSSGLNSSRPNDNGKTDNNAGTDDSTTHTRDVESEKKYTEANNDINKLKSEKSTLEKEATGIDTRITGLIKQISDIDAKLADKDSGEIDKEALEEQKNGLKKQLDDEQTLLASKKKEISAKQKEIDSKSQKSAAYKEALEKLGYSFDQVSGNLREMSEKAEKKAETKQAQLSEIRKQKSEMESLYVTNLAKMKETTELIKNNKTDQNDIDVAINSLIVAIGALNQIIAFLGCLTVFWRKIENSCEFLKDNGEIIKKLAVSYNPVLLKKKLFVFPYYKMMCYWTALSIIFGEYLAAFHTTFDKMNEKYQTSSKTPEEHWKEAKELAAEVSGKLGYEIAEAKKTSMV